MFEILNSVSVHLMCRKKHFCEWSFCWKVDLVGVVVLVFFPKIWYFEEEDFFVIAEAQEVVVAVFLFFGCNCQGPNPKYEKMIKRKGTVPVPGFFFEV